MVTTKKLLGSISYGKYRTREGEFLIPSLTAPVCCFKGIKSGERFTYGAVCYLGIEITANDVLEKMVDSGRKIENADQILKALEVYLQMLQEYKIGNILTIEPCDDAPCGYRLCKVADRPPTKPLKLP